MRRLFNLPIILLVTFLIAACSTSPKAQQDPVLGSTSAKKRSAEEVKQDRLKARSALEKKQYRLALWILSSEFDNDVAALEIKAQALWMLGEFDASLEVAKKIQQIDPQHPGANRLISAFSNQAPAETRKVASPK